MEFVQQCDWCESSTISVVCLPESRFIVVVIFVLSWILRFVLNFQPMAMVTENIKFLLFYLPCPQNLRKKLSSHRGMYVFFYIFIEKYSQFSVILTAVRFFGKHFFSDFAEGEFRLWVLFYIFKFCALTAFGYCYSKYFHILSFFFLNVKRDPRLCCVH